MKTLLQRYSAVLLAGTVLFSAALPQASISAKTPAQIQATADKETANSSDELPAAVARRVKREIARTFRIPASQLKISAAQARTWNGCFGLPAANAFCTMIALPGRQVIVTGQQRSWVYHTNQNGSQLRLNQTASLTNPSPRLQLGFTTPEDGTSNPEEPIVFQSVSEGGIANITTITKLNSEGIVTRQTIAPNIRSTPVIVKRLTREQVNNFLEQVRQQRFEHLNRLRYFSDRGADFDTIKLTDGNTEIEYANPLHNELPAQLKEVIELWQKLLQA
ncbi:hypothetical protein [Leptolyngbya sp. FACHB-17]|uniref:hypothetical protein n=1 Tax=unclassified Leptolyngbya TaxID=2650499 RepID=UPI0016815C28|nr:hypothetical protein [Leptolyngbya sp. FACHB-17]MBD2078719.1 hypothetical protein [Leptolyngbya sp. FACHB-17]